MLRQSRKLQHINQALHLYQTHQDGTLLQDVKLLHNCLPELGLADIKLDMEFVGKQIAAPIMINALTGGSDDVFIYNKRLAALAAKLNIPIAVGSQFSAVEKREMRYTFEIVRELNPTGVVLGNVGAHASIEQAREIVKMIGADALQIHINPAQELIMSEGDRDFKGYLANILAIATALDVPVIVKETGCGMAATEIEQLAAAGIRYFDIGGAGGTNFLAIEAGRAGVNLEAEFLNWGIPTAASVLQAGSVLDDSKCLIATGGIHNAMQVAKVLSLGADLAGMAMYFLELVHRQADSEACQAEFEQLLLDLKKILLLSGCSNPAQLRNKKLYIGAALRHWTELCGLSSDRVSIKRR